MKTRINVRPDRVRDVEEQAEATDGDTPTGRRVPAGVGPVCLVLLAACSSGGGGSGGFQDVDFDVTVGDGTPLSEGEPDTISANQTVTLLETDLTGLDDFILRGTIPVPRGTFPRNDGQEPFTILDYDGTPLTTQTERVTYYPDESDGADVVEVVAKVQKDPALTSGERTTYEVVYTPQADHGDGTANLLDLRIGPDNVPQVVKDLTSDPDSVIIRARDCFGNLYTARPFSGAEHMELRRYGKVWTQLRIFMTMLPEPPVSGSTGTLDHLFGVHAYVSTYADDEVVGFDLRFNNGHSGLNGGTTDDDPLDKVYFQDIEVVVPSNWTLSQHVEDPFFGDPYIEGANEVFPLVEPLNNGKLHVMRWQGQFHRRLTLSPDSASSSARAFLKQAGQGFCRRGTNALGEKYWSWWNRVTARYFAQSVQLPDLTFAGLGSLRSTIRNEFDELEEYLEQGTSENNYPIASTVLGWGHPYGVAYGGMTSGNEIFFLDGVRLAETSTRKGYRKFLITHRMHSDRQPTAFYNEDGNPTSVEDWLVVVDGTNDYLPFDHFLTPSVNPSGDVYGIEAADRFQINYVKNNGLKAPYEGQHLSWDPHDYQHFIRYTRSAKVLTWLGNDPLAKDDLLMQAENFNLSFHQYYNTAFGGFNSAGLRATQTYVNARPGKGLPFGRGESWGTDCALAAYATGTTDWRNRKRPWLERIADLVADGQSNCSGFLQATVSNKFVNGNYRARQGIEQAITENMLMGMIETVFRDQDVGRTAILTSVLQDSLVGFISPMSWFPGENAPWTYTAVGPRQLSQPVFCLLSHVPQDGFTNLYERFLNWNSLAFGREFVGDEIFFDKALLQIGGNMTLRQELEQDDDENIENRAAIIALVQFLDGDL